MKKSINTLSLFFMVLILFSSALAQPDSFVFTPTPQSGVFQGQATIDGVPAGTGDWVAAFDGDGNCAGAVELTIWEGDAYINLPIYGDDSTTPDVDEGINAGENFFLKLWDASSDMIIDYPDAFSNWQNMNGAPMPGYDNPYVVYDFSIDVPAGPTADFYADPTEGNVPLTVYFTDFSVAGDGIIVSYSWDFGDGGTSADQHPQYTYYETGTYTIILTVTDENGYSDTEIKADYVTVATPPPSGPDFALTLNAAGGSADYDLTFGMSTSATDGYDPEIDIFAPPPPPPPSFDAALGWQGERYYTQIVNGSDNDLVEHVWDIQLQYPEDNLIELTWDNTGWSVLGYFYLQDAFDGMLGINVDMTVENSLTLTNPAFTLLKLKVNPSGASAPMGPMAHFTWIANYLDVSFTDASITGDAAIVNWYWDFGDGSTSTEQNPVHTYALENTYIVTLTVTDEIGFSDTITENVTVEEWMPTGPTAAFTYQVNSLVVIFTDESVTGDAVIVNWLWNFGDGNTSSDQNPVHAYPAENTYSVSLTVTDASGFEDIVSHDVPVTIGWPYDFGSLGPFQFFPNPASGIFRGQATIDGIPTEEGDVIAAYDEDGNCAGAVELIITGGNAQINLPIYGDDPTTPDVDEGMNAGESFYLKLWVISSGMIIDYPDAFSGWQNMNGATMPGYDNPNIVYDFQSGIPTGPTAGFSWNANYLEVNFTDESVAGDGAIANWSWDFGDGYTSALQNPVHTYSAENTYIVSLTVTDENGLDDTAIQNVTVVEAPEGTTIGPFTFYPNPASGVFQGQATIDGASADDGDVIAAFDENGNCAGAQELTIYGEDAYINLPIYGDDSTTPDMDEGINAGENFYLKLWDASSDIIIDYPDAFSNWQNMNGAPMPGYDDPYEVYDFQSAVPENHPPVADNLTLSTDEDTPIEITLSGSDPDGDELTFSVVNSPQHGAFEGSIYTPDVNYNGEDSFTYIANDGELDSDPAIVSITVNALNDPPVIEDIPDQAVDEGTSFTVINLDNYVSDVETLVEDMIWAAAGQIELTVNITDRIATIIIPDPDWNGEELISFSATDTGDGTSPALSAIDNVTFTVIPVNDAPLLFEIGDQITSEDTPITITISAVDVEGDFLSFIAESDNESVTVSLVEDHLTMTPLENWYGTANITVTVNDGQLIDSETFELVVTPENDAPTILLPEVIVYDEDGILVDDFSGYINDVDEDILTLSVSGNTNVTVDIDGFVVTFGALADWNGSETLTFTVDDAQGRAFDSDDVEVRVNNINDLPVGHNDNYTVEEDQTLIVDVANGVLSNDEDVDNDELTAELVNDVSHGALTLNSDGSFTYEPDTDFSGVDEFIYRAFDGEAYSEITTVSIFVGAANNAPVAIDDSYFIDEDGILVVGAENGVLANDTDEDGDNLSSELFSNASHGIITLNDDGSFTYEPETDYNGLDEFSYRAYDGFEYSGVALVSITINPVNDSPVLVEINDQNTDEDVPLTITISANDVDSDDLTFEVTSDNENVVVDLIENQLTMTPAENWNGSAGITIIVTDGELTDSETFELTVNPVNDAPVLTIPPGGWTTDEDVPHTVTLSFFASDVDEDELVFSAMSSDPENVIVEITTTQLTMIPAENWNGTVYISVTVSDGELEDTDLIDLTVVPVNDAPVLAGIGDQETDEDTPLTITISASDVDGDDLNLSASSDNESVDVSLDNNLLILTPAENYYGTANILVTVSDGLLTDSETFGLTIISVNDLPVADAGNDISVTIPYPYNPVELILDGSGSYDLDGFIASYQWIEDEVQIATGINPTVYFSVGVHSVILTITDSDGASNTDDIVISVTGEENLPPEAYDMALSMSEDQESQFALFGTDNETPNDLTFTIVTDPEHGIVNFNRALELVTYIPNPNYFGNDFFEYSVTDIGEPPQSDTGRVDLTVLYVNDPPVISIDDPNPEMDENSTLDLNILFNDNADSVNAAMLELLQMFGPYHGALSGDIGSGVITYTPNLDYTGTDIIALEVMETGNEEPLSSELLTISVTVNSINTVPIAYNNTVSVIEDEEGTTILQASDDNDISELTYIIVDEPSHASEFELDGNVANYEPESNWDQQDQFTFMVIDAEGAESNTATITFEITPVNDAPTASSAEIPADGAAVFTFDMAEMIDDPETIDQDLEIEFIIGGGALGGTVTQIEGTTEIIYNQNVNPINMDYIPYRVNDGMLSSSVYLLTIVGLPGVERDVRTAPIATGDSIIVYYGQTATVEFIGTDITFPYDILTIEVTAGPTQGSLSDFGFFNFETLVTTYSGEYTPSFNAAAEDSIRFRVYNDDGEDYATIHITIIPSIIAPILDDIDPVSMDEDDEELITLEYSDPDTDPDALNWDVLSIPEIEGLSFSITNVTTTTADLSIVPPEDWFGNTIVEVSCTDPEDQSAVVQFQLTVNNVNDAPVLLPINDQSTDEDVSLTISIYADDIDTDNSLLQYSAVSNPEAAVSSITFEGFELAIIPTADYNGIALIELTVSDGDLTSSQQFTLTINSINDIPVLPDIADVIMDEDTEFSFSFTPEDVDGDTLTVSFTIGNEILFPAGSITVIPNPAPSDTVRTITLSPIEDGNGLSDIIVTVSDGEYAPMQNFNVTVAQVIDIPIADAGTDTLIFTPYPYNPVDVTVDGSGSYDPDGYIASYQWLENGIELAPGVNPTISFPVGIHLVTLFVTDNDGGTATDEVIVTIEAAPNMAPVANAGEDQTVVEGEQVMLDGSGSGDPENDELTFLWNAPSEIILDDMTSVNPVFTAPSVSENTVFVLTLVVNDGEFDSEPDTVNVTVLDDNPPEVENIPDQTIFTGETFEPFDLDEYLTELDGDEVAWSYRILGEMNAWLAVSINVAGGTADYDLTVGFSPDATDGYDQGIDQYAPPAPPPPAFDAALVWTGVRYYTQIVADDGDYSEHVWDIQLQYPSENLITISWDNTGWSDLGSFTLQDAFGGLLGINVDMTIETSVTLNNSALNLLKWKVTPNAPTAVRDLTIDIDAENLVSVSYTEDWTGTATVIFTATDQTIAGLSDSDTASFTVDPMVPPMASFETDITSGFAPLTVTFTNTSVLGTGDLVSYFWDFGDDSAAFAENPVHTYINAGDYLATLTVTTTHGDDISTPLSITVYEDHNPIVGDIPDQTIFAGEMFEPFDLDDFLTELDGDDVDWSHEILTGPTGFIVSLHAAGGNGEYDLTIGFSPNATDAYDSGLDQLAPPAPPPPSFDAALVWNGDRYYTQIVALDSNYIEHVWDVRLQYPEDSLITMDWDNTGWSDLGSFILQDAFGGTMVNVDMTTENSLTLDNPVFNLLKWNVTPSVPTLNRGLTIEIDTGNIVTIGYTTGWTGSTSVSFSATDLTDTGLSDSDTATFSVSPTIPPTAAFEVDTTSGLAPLTVSFTNTSDLGTGELISFLWNFGDDSTSSAENPTHTYIDDGEYNVILSVATTHGSNTSDQLTIVVTSLGISAEMYIPKEFSLYQNFPNPFNPITIISYDLPENTHVTLQVYNILGKLVIELVNGEHSSGNYNVQWNGFDLTGKPVSSGVYIYILRAGKFTSIRKMLFMK